MKELSPQQEKVFGRLREHVRRTGRTPELSEFARGMGMHYVSLKQHLEALARKGYLTFESRGRGRSPRLALPDAATGVPLLGAIPAGPLSEAVAEADAFLPLQGLGEGCFALRVDGDSMADLMQRGDVVLLEAAPPRRSGEICAVRVDEHEVTLKYVDGLGGRELVLRPHNDAYEPRSVPANAVRIEGVYRGLLRGAAAEALLRDG